MRAARSFALSTDALPASRRFRFSDFFPRLWLSIPCRRSSFPLPVSLKRFFAPLFLHCANQGRNTSSLKDEFKLGPVVQYKDFQEFYTLLAGKKVTGDEVAIVQLAVFHLTNGEGLSASDRAALQAEPVG